MEVEPEVKPPATTTPKSYPLADSQLTPIILDLVKHAAHHGQLKKANSGVTKSLKNGSTEFVVLAADAQNLNHILHIPVLAEEKNVPYIFVPSCQALAEACGVLGKPVNSCSVIKGAQLKSQIQLLKDGIKRIEESV